MSCANNRDAAYSHKPGGADLLFDTVGFVQRGGGLFVSRIHRKRGDVCATRGKFLQHLLMLEMKGRIRRKWPDGLAIPGGGPLAPSELFKRITQKLFGHADTESVNCVPVEIVGAKRYRPVGECIYCGANEAPLTDEHIIPYALNGNWVLPQSSCRGCATITGNVEQVVLRGELRHLRAALNFKTRRRADRPTSVIIAADGRDLMVPISECPIMMPFIRFPVAGLLDSRPSKNGIDAVGQVTIRWGPDPKEFAKRHGLKTLTFQQKLAPAEFARMLAKIAFSHAVARFGLDSLQLDLVTAVILGKSEGIGDVVGCSKGDFPLPPNPSEHVLQPVLYKGGPTGEDSLLAIRVKLFSGSPTPGYEVVLGRPANWLEDTLQDYRVE